MVSADNLFQKGKCSKTTRRVFLAAVATAVIIILGGLIMTISDHSNLAQNGFHEVQVYEVNVNDSKFWDATREDGASISFLSDPGKVYMNPETDSVYSETYGLLDGVIPSKKDMTVQEPEFPDMPPFGGFLADPF